jgi:type I restriction enzyme M protein
MAILDTGQRYAPITIADGASFADMVALKGKSDIGDQINKKILGPLAKANNLSDMPDFNDANKRRERSEIVARARGMGAKAQACAREEAERRLSGLAAIEP